MNDDRFAPPSAEVRDVVADKPGSPVIGFIAGLVANIGGSLLVSAVVVAIVAASVFKSGMSSQDIETLVDWMDNPLVDIIEQAVDFLFAAFGGYVCERIARRRHLRLGTALGLVSVLIALAVVADFTRPLNLAVLCAMSMIGALSGTQLAIRQMR